MFFEFDLVSTGFYQVLPSCYWVFTDFLKIYLENSRKDLTIFFQFWKGFHCYRTRLNVDRLRVVLSCFIGFLLGFTSWYFFLPSSGFVRQPIVSRSWCRAATAMCRQLIPSITCRPTFRFVSDPWVVARGGRGRGRSIDCAANPRPRCPDAGPKTPPKKYWRRRRKNNNNNNNDTEKKKKKTLNGRPAPLSARPIRLSTRSLPGFYLLFYELSVSTHILPGFTEFYRVLPGFTGFYRVLPGFTGFYLVLPDSIVI